MSASYTLFDGPRWRVVWISHPKRWAFGRHSVDGLLMWDVTDVGPLAIIFKRSAHFAKHPEGKI